MTVDERVESLGLFDKLEFLFFFFVFLGTGKKEKAPDPSGEVDRVKTHDTNPRRGSSCWASWSWT